MDLHSLKKFLLTKRKIVIVTHKNPDGDAIGSVLGLHLFLKKIRHESTVIIPNDFGKYLKWLPGTDEIINFEVEKEKAVQLIKDAELYFCIDFSALSRVEEFKDLLIEQKKPIVTIDHHPGPEDFDDFRYHSVKAAAAAELVYKFISEIDESNALDQDIATCLYIGIVTDTGSFRYSSTTPETHLVTAELIKTGINIASISDRLFSSFQENNIRFFGFCFLERLTVLPDLRTAFIAVSRKDLYRFNIQRGQTEGLVNFPLSIENIKFAALFKEDSNFVKISFRSKGEFPANKFAAQHFNGGGHLNASGGRCDKSLEDTVKLFTEKLQTFKNELLRED